MPESFIPARARYWLCGHCQSTTQMSVRNDVYCTNNNTCGRRRDVYATWLDRNGQEIWSKRWIRLLTLHTLGWRHNGSWKQKHRNNFLMDKFYAEIIIMGRRTRDWWRNNSLGSVLICRARLARMMAPWVGFNLQNLLHCLSACKLF